MLFVRLFNIGYRLSISSNIPSRYFKDPAYYFKLSNELTPFDQSLIIMKQIQSIKFSHQEFDKIWPTFNYFISSTLTRIALEPSADHDKGMQFLALSLKIWKQYNTKQQFTSRHMILAINKFCQISIEKSMGKPLNSFLNVIYLMSKYNLKKARFVFLNRQGHIGNLLNQLSATELLNLLSFMRNTELEISLFREVAINNLYTELHTLSAGQLSDLLYSLSTSHRYINKNFISALANNYLDIFKGSLKSQPLQFSSIIYSLSNFSQIQQSMNNRSIFLEEMDDLYEAIFQYISEYIKLIRSNLLAALAATLRRSKFYHKVLIKKIYKEALKRNILEFFPEEKSKPDLMKFIRFDQFVNIFHMLASMNCQDSFEFNKYALQILKLLQLKKGNQLQIQTLDRIIWSACVLFTKMQMIELYQLVNHYFQRAGEMPQHLSLRNSYYCYLYLKIYLPKIMFPQEIIDRLAQEPMRVKISLTQKEVYKAFIAMGVPCIMEFNINNLMCDILIPEWKSLKNVVIDIHGFHHFLRNVKKTNGSHELKKKLLENSCYHYYYISLDEWAITSNKKQFAMDFLESLNAIEQNKKKTK